MLQTPGNLCLIFAEKMMEGNSYSEAHYGKQSFKNSVNNSISVPVRQNDVDVVTLHRISEEERKIHAGRKWVYSRHK